MSRKENLQTRMPNPSTKYLEWSSESKNLKYYDKESGENKHIEIPVKFVVLTEKHTIGGFNKANKCGIFSNEITNISKESLTVRLSKKDAGKTLQGIYADIKGDIGVLGGKYAKSIYLMNEAGEIVNLKVIGSSNASWMDFCKNARSKFVTNWITLTGSKAEKNGSNKYNVPVFGVGEVIDENADKLAEKAYDLVEEFFKSKNSTTETAEDFDEQKDFEESAQPVAVGENEDDLPF